MTFITRLRIAAIYLITLIHVVDGSIVNLAVLSMAGDMRFHPHEGQWIVTAFGIGMATSVPFVTRWTDWLGDRAALAWALLASAGAMLACALAADLVGVVVARFIQGVCSGVVVLLCQRQLMTDLGPDRRAFALGLWTSAIAIAPVIGPFFGAVVIHQLSWRWIFLLQVPLLAVSAACIVHALALRRSGDKPAPSVALFATVALAMWFLQVGIDQLLASDGRAAALSLSGALLAAAASRTLLQREGQSLFKWALFSHGSYLRSMSTVATLNGMAVLNGLVYPLWLQAEFHLGVLDMAAILCVGGLIGGITSPLVGSMKQKQAYPLLVLAGLSCFVASFFWCTRLEPGAHFVELMAPRVLLGLGIALISPLNYLAVQGLEGRDVLEANSLGMFMRALIANLIVVAGATGVKFLGQPGQAAALTSTNAMHVTYAATALAALALAGWHARSLLKASPSAGLRVS